MNKEDYCNEEQVVISQIMQPHDANPLGNIHGGVIMNYIDNAAAVVATRYAKGMAVTASIDRLEFFKPVHVGNLLVLKAALNWVGRSSMEIGVRVEAEELASGSIKHISSAYLTFVAISTDGKSRPVASLNLTNDRAKRRFREAQARHDGRGLEKKMERQCQADITKCQL